MDRGSWGTTVHSVAESDKTYQLTNFFSQLVAERILRLAGE